jgi:hypothetical protein
MSDPENFLARWSRRKLAPDEQRGESPEREQGKPADAPQGASAQPQQTSPERPASDASETRSVSETQSVSKPPALDLASLPSIESITASTDIRVFLQAGVPEALRRAALRRAWAIDPAIRDYIGPAENQWDFTSPETPGFGPIDADKVKRLVAGLFGETKPEPQRAAEPHVSSAIPTIDQRTSDQSAPSPNENQVPGEPHGTSGKVALQSSTVDAAPRNEEVRSQSVPTHPRRGHGGALPR